MPEDRARLVGALGIGCRAVRTPTKTANLTNCIVQSFVKRGVALRRVAPRTSHLSSAHPSAVPPTSTVLLASLRGLSQAVDGACHKPLRGTQTNIYASVVSSGSRLLIDAEAADGTPVAESTLRSLHDDRRDLYFYVGATDDRLQAAVQQLKPLEEPDIPSETTIPEQEIRTIVRDEIRRHQQ
jgi:hypothetical protein